MKKILVLFGLFLLLQGFAYAQEQNEVLKAGIKMSDVVVFSEKNTFGIKDKSGNVLVKPQYKKIIRLGNSSWLVLKKNKYGIMDSEGNYLVYPKYRHADRVFGKFAKLGNDKDYGLYDETGKAIIPAEYQKIDPLFGKMFLTCKNFKYGITDFQGKVLLKNEYDDIYMPNPKVLRIQYEGEWYEIERAHGAEIKLPENVKRVTINNKDYNITHLIADTGVLSGYSALTVTDYALKVFSSISPAYEQTIDDLMFSQGAEGVSVFIKLGWIPRFPFTYAKKYFDNLRAPNNGPLSEIRNDMKKQMK